MNVRKSIAAAALAAAALAGAVGVASPASANTSDQAFLQVLHQRGISHDSGDALMIGAGHDVCTNMDHGYTATQEISTIYRVSQLSWSDSGYFVGASIAAYCPEYI